MYKDLNTSFDIMDKIVTYIKHFVILTSFVEYVTQTVVYILSQNRKSTYILEGT